MTPRDTVRLAAVSDIHFGRTPMGVLHTLFAQIVEAADVLLLCGDLTDTGNPEEGRGLAHELAAVRIPMVGVLGNHDYECDRLDELKQALHEGGIRILDGDADEILGIGFAGVKGFAGGFGRGALGPWGEPAIKAFVQEALSEALKFEKALAKLRTPSKVGSPPNPGRCEVAQSSAAADAQQGRAPALRADQRDRRGGAAGDLSLPGVGPAGGAALAVSRGHGLPRTRAPWRAGREDPGRHPGVQRVDGAAPAGVARAAALPGGRAPGSRRRAAAGDGGRLISRRRESPSRRGHRARSLPGGRAPPPAPSPRGASSSSRAPSP